MRLQTQNLSLIHVQTYLRTNPNSTFIKTTLATLTTSPTIKTLARIQLTKPKTIPNNYVNKSTLVILKKTQNQKLPTHPGNSLATISRMRMPQN